MSEPTRRPRRLIRLVAASALALTIALGLVGQVVRDRAIVFALLMYVPLVPLGLLAMAFDAICRGWALPRGRFALGAIGLVATLGGAWPMIGLTPLSPTGDGQDISVLHWNVLWGGGLARNPAKWASLRAEILRQGADLVVLSEAPPDDWLDQLANEMGPGASRVQLENRQGDAYWFKLAVFSKGPLRLLGHEPVADGTGMIVEAEVRGRKARLLVVDARSHPLLPREPRLLDVADACRRAREVSEPYDVVLGDFNTLSRSLGFVAIEAEGYALAGRSSGGWRGTFPSVLPIYDIDHVFVRRDDPLYECRFFTNFTSDHRGQVVRFRPMAPAIRGRPGR